MLFIILQSNYSNIYCNDVVKKKIKYNSRTDIVMEIKMLSQMKWGLLSYLYTAEIIRSY